MVGAGGVRGIGGAEPVGVADGGGGDVAVTWCCAGT